MRNSSAKSFLLFLFLVGTLNVFANEYSSEQKGMGLYNYLNKIALKNGTPEKEEGYTFTQKDIGKVAYFLDYYLFTIEDLKKAETIFATSELKITDKNYADVLYLLRSFSDIAKIMRSHQIFSKMKCRFLYGENQDHALAISPIIQQSFKREGEFFVPAFVGGCWQSQRFPEQMFPSYIK